MLPVEISGDGLQGQAL